MSKREEILNLVKEYYLEEESKKKPYKEGDYIHYASRVYDEEELINLVDSSLDFWLTAGRYCAAFEKEFARFLGTKYCALTTSGSSANLLAFMALTSAKLGDRQIKRGDEVITVACGFPTTVTPIIQYGAIPVFIDVTLPSFEMDVSKLEEALSPKTKAVMVAHTLGNTFDLKAARDFCKKHNLWLIEDNCDALGSKYFIDGEWKYTGTIGDIGTSSFYPAHHMTMGEGGAVYTNNPMLSRLIKSFRDWGRDCICPPGQDNFCGKRFSGQFGELPYGFDHKYVYGEFGYNLKVTDMQGAIGLAQLKKLPTFIERRKHNWNRLHDALAKYSDKLTLCEATPNSDPSWFGFLIYVKEPLSRNDMTTYLEKHGVQTRNLFAGNLLRHPVFDEMRKEGTGYRVVGSLETTDKIMNNAFWIGVYPGMSDEMIDYMIKQIENFLNGK